MKFNPGRNDHPDKAALLAWSEGEMRWWRAWRVGRHVSSCWQCRGELSELESIICAVSLDIQDLPEPSRVDVARAWWRFREATRHLEATPAARQFRPLRPGWALGATILVATVGLAFVTTSTWQRLFAPAAVEKPRPAAPRALNTPSPRDLAPPPGIAPRTELPAPLASGPGNDELIAAEIQAVAALHRSRFCLNSGITVRRADSEVEVTGMVQSADERDRITGILAGIGAPGVVRILLAEPSSILEGVPASTPSVPAADPPAVKPGTPPIGLWLRENAGSRARLNEREIVALMNSLVLESEQVSSEAWAIRHLAEQFPEPLTRRISPELAEQLHQMVDDHSIALANGLQRLRSRLDQMSGAAAPPGAPSAARPDETWQTRVLALQREVEEVVRQLLLAFSAEAGSGTAQDFSTLLVRLDEQSRHCLTATSDLRTGLRWRTASAR